MEDLHIGHLILAELRRQGRTVTWFAQNLPCDRSNAYDIFHRSSIDTALLLRISQLLHHDFFSVFSQELKDKTETSVA